MSTAVGFLPHWPGEAEAINADSFDDDVLAAPEPVLVEFWAARCAACPRLAPLLSRVAAEGAVRVFTLDVDTELPAAERCGVRALPTVILFALGEERGRLVGAISEPRLRSFLAEHKVH